MKFSRLLVVILIAFIAIPLAAQMGEDNNGRLCSPATVKGTFGSYAQGTSLVPFPGSPPPPYAAVAVGLHTFDGEGNWSITYATSLGGLIVPWGATIVGTYTVSPDCSLSVTGITVPAKFVGTITGEGMVQEIYITYTDPARVQSGILRRTPRSGCSEKTVKGTYAGFGQGAATLPSYASPVPIAHVGSFVADGEGTFAGEETLKIANATFTDTFTAKYEVSHDCKVSAEITTESIVLHEVGIITREGTFQEIHLIVTDPGWVFADTGKRE